MIRRFLTWTAAAVLSGGCVTPGSGTEQALAEFLRVVQAQPCPGAGCPGTMAVINTPAVCVNITHTRTVVGTTATNVPAAAQAPRRYIDVANSIQNTGSPRIKCRADGTAPVMAVGNIGDVLAVGESKTYYIGATRADALAPLQCISDTAGTEVLGYECL